MHIGFVVNRIAADDAGQTTYRLAARCTAAGHEAWVFQTGDFTYDPAREGGAWATRSAGGGGRSAEAYLEGLQSRGAVHRWIGFEDLDVLLLRSNPSVQAPWARYAGIQFGLVAVRQGVIVLSDPAGLSRATSKLYLLGFPEATRPRTLVTRNPRRIEQFVRAQGRAVLKPLEGSGGRGVFLLRAEDPVNMGDIIRAVRRDGYVMAQEYIPEAAEGDTRLFLLNGAPLLQQGHYCAFRRIRTGDDLRSNIHAGGRLRRARIGETELRLAELVRPRLVADGMFLVGLDIAGGKLMEINVFSPGGLGSAQLVHKVDFTESVVESLERKVEHVRSLDRRFDNVAVATL